MITSHLLSISLLVGLAAVAVVEGQSYTDYDGPLPPRPSIPGAIPIGVVPSRGRFRNQPVAVQAQPAQQGSGRGRGGGGRRVNSAPQVISPFDAPLPPPRRISTSQFEGGRRLNPAIPPPPVLPPVLPPRPVVEEEDDEDDSDSGIGTTIPPQTLPPFRPAILANRPPILGDDDSRPQFGDDEGVRPNRPAAESVFRLRPSPAPPSLLPQVTARPIGISQYQGQSQPSFRPQQQQPIGRPVQQEQPVRSRPSYAEQPIRRPQQEVTRPQQVVNRPQQQYVRQQVVSNRPEKDYSKPSETPSSHPRNRHRKPVAQVLRKYREDHPDGSITWGFENDDGTFKEETIGVDCITRGKYGYFDPDGVKREFTYSSGLRCDSNKDSEAEGSDQGYIDYSNNRYVLPNGDYIELTNMVKNRARKPVYGRN